MLMHWKWLEQTLGPIVRVSPRYDLKELFERKKALPNWRMRFCTSELKIKPMQCWINEQSDNVCLYVGLRADEEGREGGLYENCTVRFPLREWGWGETEVQDYLNIWEIDVPERTDCARCFFQRLSEWWDLWREHPDVYKDAEKQEAQFGHTFRSPSRDTWPASLAGLRQRFEKGDVPRGAGNGTDFSANKCRVCTL